MAVCSFEGCGRYCSGPTGLCLGHKKQKLRGGELKEIVAQVQYHGYSREKRFLARVGNPGQTGCREWQGSKNPTFGHGQWRNEDGEIELTHRAAWRMFVGEIPAGMNVLHTCDNPSCVNIKHLFLGTQADNMKDMWAKGRARPAAHKGEKHGMSKINAEIVREIRSSSESGTKLASRFNLTPTTICDIRKRRTWNHVE